MSVNICCMIHNKQKINTHLATALEGAETKTGPCFSGQCSFSPKLNMTCRIHGDLMVVEPHS